jgi:hypothetical protein
MTDVVIHVDGSQPEAGCTQEEPLSQVDNIVDMESNEAGILECLSQACGGQQAIRMSSRIISQYLHSTRISERASKNVATRDVSGTDITSHNSFALLDDDIICDRALEMGVNPRTFTMYKINYSKDLEQARHAIDVAETAQDLVTESDSDKIVLLGFERDQDLGEEDEFTPVLSRRNRKKRRSVGEIWEKEGDTNKFKCFSQRGMIRVQHASVGNPKRKV